MLTAKFLQSMTMESAILLIGSALLFAILVALHIKNIRWVRDMASNEASMQARNRVEKLLQAVERMSAGAGAGKSRVALNRPVGKGSKRIPAVRTGKPQAAYRRAR
ncbi:MAG TPA: hypothetical protein VF449_10170 [Parvibaculum sp.]